MIKILMPIDGSEASIKAAAKAVEIAKQADGHITFINVLYDPVPSSVYEYDPAWVAEIVAMMDKVKKKENEMLDDIIKKLNMSDIKFDKKLEFGDAYQVILKEASEGSYDLIVMGRRGFSKFKRFFMGSVTQRVLSDSSCPVLVINE